MARTGPDDAWEGWWTETGWIPADDMERVAICMIDGGCTLRNAQRIATAEAQSRGVSGKAPGLARAAPTMLEYSAKLAERRGA